MSAVNPRREIFAFLAPYLKPPGWGNRELLEGMDAHLDRLGVPRSPAPPVPANADPLTLKVALELIGHEGFVREAYKDSVGVWTWGPGITNASGHIVYPRYKDKPQTLRRCLEVFVWLLRERYIPAVEAAFAGRALAEEQFAAALSFHYNTGAISEASWVKQWKSGDEGAAHRSFLLWNKPREIIPRRTRERDLFFDGRWSHDGKATVFPVRKPSYTPDWRRAERVDVRPILEELLR